eukprot:UN23206
MLQKFFENTSCTRANLLRKLMKRFFLFFQKVQSNILELFIERQYLTELFN